MFFTDWVTQTALSQKLRRKFQEQYLALQLEKKDVEGPDFCRII